MKYSLPSIFLLGAIVLFKNTSLAVGPDDPCYSYLSDEKQVVIASCTNVLEGKVSDIYKNTVTAASLCLLKQKNLEADNDIDNGQKSEPEMKKPVYKLEGTIDEENETTIINSRKLDLVAAGEEDESEISFTKEQDVINSEILFKKEIKTLSLIQKKNSMFVKRIINAKLICNVFTEDSTQ